MGPAPLRREHGGGHGPPSTTSPGLRPVRLRAPASAGSAPLAESAVSQSSDQAPRPVEARVRDLGHGAGGEQRRRRAALRGRLRKKRREGDCKPMACRPDRAVLKFLFRAKERFSIF